MKSAKKARSAKDKRKTKRWNVAILVRCSLPKLGDEVYEMEMWARDVNDKGLKLELAQGLSINLVHKGGVSEDHQVRFEDIAFHKGSAIKVQDLFYDDDGTGFIKGEVAWARRNGRGNWEIGVELDESRKAALKGAFRDFLSIVKNPALVIKRASKK